MSNPIKLHYSSSKMNWGDQLSPVICGILANRKVIYSKASKCDMIAIGSILSRAKETFFAKKIHVWGSGFIKPVGRHKTRHIIHAVRGHKTAEILTNVNVKALGDPGLLCDLLIPNYKDVKKRYNVGIVPHYKERDHPEFLAFMATHPDIVFIDIFSETLPFLEKLASCRFILSSSLHGLVAADALEIPNCRFKLSDEIVGGDFKFEDYYSIFNINQPTPTALDKFNPQFQNQISKKYNRPSLKAIKQSLINAFPFN